RIAKVERCIFVRFIDRLSELSSPISLQPRVTSVANNREQPGSALATAIATEKPESSQICLLHGIFGILIVVHQPARQIVSGRQMRQHHFLEANRAASFRQNRTSP